jgi:hypothetical protein
MRAPASSRRQEWQNDLGKVRRGVEAALGKRTDAGVRALHLAGDHQKVWLCRAGAGQRAGLSPRRRGKLFHQLPELRPLGRRARPRVVALSIGIA